MYLAQVPTTSINRCNSLWETNSPSRNRTEVSPEAREKTPGTIAKGSITFPLPSREAPGVERQSFGNLMRAFCGAECWQESAGENDPWGKRPPEWEAL